MTYKFELGNKFKLKKLFYKKRKKVLQQGLFFHIKILSKFRVDFYRGNSKVKIKFMFCLTSLQYLTILDNTFSLDLLSQLLFRSLRSI